VLEPFGVASAGVSLVAGRRVREVQEPPIGQVAVIRVLNISAST
jgi:hypothetical protein